MSFLKSFFFGVIAAFIASVLEVLFLLAPDFDFNSLFREVSWILVFFVLIEELLKIAFLWKIFSETNKNTSKMILFYQSIFLGLGFALAETLLKIFSALYENSLQPFSYPTFFGAILIHLITSGLIGYLMIKIFLSNQNLAEKNSLKNKVFLYVKFLGVLLISFTWHFLYNCLIIYTISFFIISVFLLASLVFIVFLSSRIATYQKTYAQ